MNKKFLIVLLIILLFWYYKKQKAKGLEWGGSGAGIFAGLQEIWNWNNNIEIDPETGEPIKEEDKPTKWDLADPLKPSDPDPDPVKPKEDLSKDVVTSTPPKPTASTSTGGDSKFTGIVNWKARP